MLNNYRYAKPETLAKVAATKDADGHVSMPARMQSASFQALVRADWLEEVQVPAPPTHWRPYFVRYVVTAKGAEVLAKHVVAEANPFVGGHGAKAQETFRQLGTVHSDWFHPAVKWVRETRDMPFEQYKKCPTCQGDNYVRFDAEGKAIPNIPLSKGYDHAEYMAWNERLRVARNEAQKAGGCCWNGNCPTCKKTGRRGSSCEGKVFDRIVMKPVEMMVGYILWPKGVKKNVSRFQGNINARCQCEICGKGINKSNRVPVAHDKNGKVYGMYVGEDCARKFTKVAKIAKPSKDENKKGLPSVLDENYEVPA